jgi:hypothetical protein
MNFGTHAREHNTRSSATCVTVTPPVALSTPDRPDLRASTHERRKRYGRPDRRVRAWLSRAPRAVNVLNCRGQGRTLLIRQNHCRAPWSVAARELLPARAEADERPLRRASSSLPARASSRSARPLARCSITRADHPDLANLAGPELPSNAEEILTSSCLGGR